MKLEDKYRQIYNDAFSKGEYPVPEELQGVTKARIENILAKVAANNADIIDVVFALLDNERESCFPKASEMGFMFNDGASTGHLACHVGILQRGKTKLDREGRDYWIKPLRDLGAIEAVTFDSLKRKFILGHPIAKSPNSAYRLDVKFMKLLLAPAANYEPLTAEWLNEDAIRERIKFQAEAASIAREHADTKHSDLIKAACEQYVPRYLPGFVIIYIDDGDGDRITDEEKGILLKAGISISLDDAMPDVLLWDRANNKFWVIEAVTSDGEVDLHKQKKVWALLKRNKLDVCVGFTTVYRTWKEAAARQGKMKNLAPNTWLWIIEDASRQFFVTS